MILPRAHRINRPDGKKSSLADLMIRITGIFAVIHARQLVVMMLIHWTAIIRMIPVSGENAAGDGEQGDAG
jgi:hypothetical protein